MIPVPNLFLKRKGNGKGSPLKRKTVAAAPDKAAKDLRMAAVAVSIPVVVTNALRARAVFLSSVTPADVPQAAAQVRVAATGDPIPALTQERSRRSIKKKYRKKYGRPRLSWQDPAAAGKA
jgi:hypothetical protein